MYLEGTISGNQLAYGVRGMLQLICIPVLDGKNKDYRRRTFNEWIESSLRLV